MTIIARIPSHPFTPNTNPGPKFEFTCAGLSFLNVGFPRNRECYRLLGVGDSGEMEWIKRLGSSWFTGCCSKKDATVEIETVDSGEDIFDAAATAGESMEQPDHLVIMVNGLIGSSEDWRYAAGQFVKKLPDKVIVHRSECNSSMLTFDGVDRMGERLAEEVIDVIRHWHGVRKISFVAHSLGGLVARYAIGRLYELSPKTGSTRYGSHEEINVSTRHRNQIGGLEPMNFITFATPHLGSRGHKQLPFLCGLPFLEKSVSQTAHWVAGRSGKHLFLTDEDDGRPPLLLRMVNDSDDIHFMSALRSFKRRVAYANANYDHVVGWRTSSIRRPDELPKSNLLVSDTKYPHIIYIDQRMAETEPSKASSAIQTQVIDLEEEMIRGLNQVTWERIDVSFHKSRQRYVAHNTIQVKTYWLNSDGADVVHHMIDCFLL